MRRVLACGRDDFVGREADTVVDDIHADIARADGDLLRTVRMAVEAGLGDEEGEFTAELFARDDHFVAQLSDALVIARGRSRGDARRSAILPENLPQHF